VPAVGGETGHEKDMVALDHLLLRALRGEWTATVPFLPYSGVWPARLLGVTADRYLHDATLLARGAVRLAREFGADGVPLMTDPQMEALSLGCKAHWSEVSPPSVASHPLGQVAAERFIEADGDVFPPLPTGSEGRWPIVIEAGRRVRAELEGGASDRPVALIGMVSGPCTIATHLRGLALFRDVATHPAAADALFGFAGRVTAAAARIYVETIGCDVVVINDTPAAALKRTYVERYVTPHLQPALRIIHAAGRVSALWA